MAEAIFTKSLCFQVKSKEFDDRVATLDVALSVRTSPAPLQKKYLYVQLTDKKDSFFLYTLKLDEEDFQTLKVSQGLLVDFPSFPQKLMGLLSLCLDEAKKETPKFILQLSLQDGKATLNVVETNPFKHLTHLSLQVVPGNDEAVKTFLSECLRDYKERNEKLTNELRSTETSLRNSLSATEEALSARNAELASMKLQWESRLSEIQAQNAHHINSEKEESLKSQSQTQQRFLQEKRDLEQAHMKIVKQLEARVYELDTQNKELTETKFVNDASIRDLTSKLSLAEEEGLKMRQDVQQLRKDNMDLESDLHRHEKSENQLLTRVAVLEQQVHDKDTVIGSSNDLLHAEQAQKKLLDDELTNSKSRVVQLELNTKTLSDEIVKANEIIRKLQQEGKNVQAKLKLRSQIALRQEEVLKEKEKEADSAERETIKMREELEKCNSKLKEFESKLQIVESEKAECEKKIASNENVISWLNKQLDQVQMGRARVAQPIPTHTVSLTQHNSRQSTSLATPDGPQPVTPEVASKIPQPKYKSTPIVPPTTEGKENEPIVDAKYLPAETRPAVVPLKARNWMLNSGDPLMLPAKPRISKEQVNPHSALATAYFPRSK
ncbi:spindle assembly abnormal protein 6 homolog [Watersipora subatra]|uniref:spindle assembly abnormal protein 6 homolog n=1 Tax=Watersipora subatra TaxID=2589382 RepID=UPI00355C1974